MPVEEIRGGVIGLQPRLMAQETMNLVGKHEVGILDALGAQRRGETHGFREVDVVVVIPVDEQHR